MDTTLTLDGEMKLNLKMDSEFTGKHYTLDFDLNPSGMWGIHITGDVDGPVDAKWTMQKDYTMGEIVVKYKNQNYAFMQLKGNAEMRGVFPVVFDYVVKYNIKDAMEHQGKAKMKFDGKTPRLAPLWTSSGTWTSAPGSSTTMTSRCFGWPSQARLGVKSSLLRQGKD